MGLEPEPEPVRGLEHSAAMACDDCGWSFAGPRLVPCGIGEGVSVPGAGCGAGFSPECAGIVPLDACLRLCEAHPSCDVVSWGKSTQDCYMKRNPQACGSVASDHMCPTLPADYEYHMRCSCAIAGTFANGAPKVFGCPAQWGRALLVFIVAVVAVYLGGGAAFRRRRGSRGVDMLPHRAQWQEFFGLVADGVQFSRSTAQGGGTGRSLQQPLANDRGVTLT